MTAPLAPPPRKNPQRRTPAPLAPPAPRSRAAHALSAWAAAGVVALQHCARCGTVLYPPRDACAACLSTQLAFRPVETRGAIVARSTIRTAIDPYFRERMPWRVASVRLSAGVSVIAHLHGDVGDEDEAVRLVPRLDRIGNAAFVAIPPEDTEHMHDDPILRELSAHPRHRRALVTDARGPLGQACVRALLDAGAAHVFAGVAEDWKPFPGEELLADERISRVPLDVTDTRSVNELAGEIGGKADILVNTARHVRPGHATSSGIAAAQDALAVNALGLVRLAQAFGPAMAARAADGTNDAVAFASFVHVAALAAGGGWQGASHAHHDASQAAALSTLQALRRELPGIRVLSLFTGAIEDEWTTEVAPPKLSPARAARALVEALIAGQEDAFAGDMAEDFATRWRADPRALQKELAS